jgi:5-methyltetrahydrofolate--homocysteine methyltransferase
VMVTCMPNAGCRADPDGARYPLTPQQLADAHTASPPVGLGPWSAVAAARRPSTSRRRGAVSAGGHRRSAGRRPEAGVASLYQHVPFRQDTSVPVLRRAHQRQRLQGVPRGMLEGAGTTASTSPGADPATAPTCSTVCVDYVASRRRADPEVSAGSRHRRRCRSCSDSTEPRVLAGGPRAARRARSSSTRSTTRTATARPRSPAHAAVGARRRRPSALIDERGQARTASGRCASPPLIET